MGTSRMRVREGEKKNRSRVMIQLDTPAPSMIQPDHRQPRGQPQPICQQKLRCLSLHKPPHMRLVAVQPKAVSMAGEAAAYALRNSRWSKSTKLTGLLALR